MVLSEVEYSELMHVDNMGKHRLFYYNIARDVRDRMLQRNFDEFSCIWAEKIKTPHGIIVTKILKLDMSKLVSKVHKNVLVIKNVCYDWKNDSYLGLFFCGLNLSY